MAGDGVIDAVFHAVLFNPLLKSAPYGNLSVTISYVLPAASQILETDAEVVSILILPSLAAHPSRIPRQSGRVADRQVRKGWW